MGPSPRRNLGDVRQCWIIGIANEAVFPLPVSAQPRMSRPESAMGMPCAWMGVGDWYSRCRMSNITLACRFCGRNGKV